MGGEEGVAMRSLNITPEQFAQLLRDNNVTREQFIALYGLRPLVYIPELPRRAKAAFVLVCALIFALALFGNCLVLYVVTRSRAMRTVTNIFICSLALSDLLIAFFCVPFTMLQNISSNWLGGACRRGTGRDGTGSPRALLAKNAFPGVARGCPELLAPGGAGVWVRGCAQVVGGCVRRSRGGFFALNLESELCSLWWGEGCVCGETRERGNAQGLSRSDKVMY